MVGYDGIIIGGGIEACAAALSARARGERVVVIEPRTYLGRRFTATLRPWLTLDGQAELPLLQNIARELERAGTTADNELIRYDLDGADLVGFGTGRLKALLLESLRRVEVPVLFAARPVGFLEGDSGEGVVIATTSGLLLVRSNWVVDLSRREPGGGPGTAAATARTVEYEEVGAVAPGKISVPAELGLAADAVIVHAGHHSPTHRLVELRFAGLPTDRAEAEVVARERTVTACEYIHKHIEGFSTAILGRISCELWVEGEPNGLSEAPTMAELDKLCASAVELVRRASKGATATRRDIPADATLPRADAGESFIRFRRGGRVPLSTLEPTTARSTTFLDLLLEKLHAPSPDAIHQERRASVLVVGGGTAGAPAAIGAGKSAQRARSRRSDADSGNRTSEHGRSAASDVPADAPPDGSANPIPVLLIEASSHLGGTGTIGGVNTYYHGNRKGFTEQYDKAIAEVRERVTHHHLVDPEKAAGRWNLFPWNIEVKSHAALLAIRREAGDVRFETQFVDAVTEEVVTEEGAKQRITGCILAGPSGLEYVPSDIVVDTSGRGDVAAAAGVPFVLGDPRGGNMQTFNQCNWKWRETFSGINVDIDVIDDTDFTDTIRGIYIAHERGDRYDFSYYPAIRESRRIRGKTTFTLKDVFIDTNRPDEIAVGQTDFDQHGLQGTLYSRMGFLPYHHSTYRVKFPFGALVPVGVTNLLVGGKAFSASKDAFSFMRMQPDQQNLGFILGVAAARAAEQRGDVGSIDVGMTHGAAVALGADALVASETPGAVIEPTDETPERMVAALAQGDEPALSRIVLYDPDEMLPLLEKAYVRAADRGRLLLAMACTWFGSPVGLSDLVYELTKLRELPGESSWDSGGRPLGGFHGSADTYWRVNQLITLLALPDEQPGRELILDLTAATDTGGEVNYHDRIHWRRVPNYDRIVSLAFYHEYRPSREAAEALSSLLSKPGMWGHEEYERADGNQNYPSAYLELAVARALARCGGAGGARRLVAYLGDVRKVLSDHAHHELVDITGRDFGWNRQAWIEWLGSNPVPIKSYREHERV